MTPGVIRSSCNGVYLIGGYDILSGSNPGGEFFIKTYSGLKSHTMIYFAFTLYEIDSWDLDDYLQIAFDLTVISSTWQLLWNSYAGQTNKCGNPSIPDLVNMYVFGTAHHTLPTLNLKLISQNNEASPTESFGFRDITLLIANPSNLFAFDNSMCVFSSQPFPNGVCDCIITQYKDVFGDCRDCNTLCSSCFGPSSSECYQCTLGAGWDGTKCVWCDSSCSVCHGPLDTDCDTCSSGRLLFNSKYCITPSACHSPLSIAYDSCNNGQCSSTTCDSPNYLYWDGSCDSSCIFPLKAEPATYYLQYCNFPCATTTDFLYWNGTCASSCSDSLRIVPYKGRRLCKYTCSAGQYLYYNTTCYSSCSLPLVTRIEAGNNYCDYPCTSGQFLYWDGTCQSSCLPPLADVIISTKHFCYFTCLWTEYLYWNGTCSSSCNYPLLPTTSYGSKFCTYSCPTSQYLYYNATCAGSCSTPPFVLRVEGSRNYCDYPCSSSQFLYWDGSCQPTCDTLLIPAVIGRKNFCFYPCLSGQYLYWNGTCLNSCDPPFVLKTSYSQNFCNYKCPTGQYLYYNTTCYSSCNPPLVPRLEDGEYYCDYPCTSIQFLYWDGSCQASCTSPLISNTYGGKQFCYFKCPVSQYLYWNGTCADSCTYPLANATTLNRKFCNYICGATQSLYYDQTCQNSCVLPLRSRLEAGKNYCDYPCTVDQYLYWDGVCQSECPSPLVIQVYGFRNFCTYPCSSSQQLYWDGSCESSCPSPLNTTYVHTKPLCVFQCLYYESLYWDGTCRPTCPLPLVVEVVKTRQICTSPCSAAQFIMSDSTCSMTCNPPNNKVYDIPPYKKCVSSTVYYYPTDYTYKKSCPIPYTANNDVCYLDVSQPEAQQIRSISAGITSTNTISSIGLMINTIIATSSPAFIMGAGLMKILEYMRYMDITHSAHLELLFVSFKPSLGIIHTNTLKMTKEMKDSFNNGSPIEVFGRYNILPSFLVSFWDGLVSLLILSSCVGILWILNKAVIEMQGSSHLRFVMKFVKIAAQNYLLAQFYNNYGDIVLYTLLELRALNVYSISTTISFLTAVCFVIISSFYILKHIRILMGWQKQQEMTSASQISSELKLFKDKHASSQVLFADFKHYSIIQQGFVLILTSRILFYSLMLTLLFGHPLAQIILFFICSFIMLAYILIKKPFCNTIDFIEQICIELLIIVANISFLSISILDYTKGRSMTGAKYWLSEVIIGLNILAVFIPPIFLVPKWATLGQKAWREYKNWRREQLTAHMDTSIIPSSVILESNRDHYYVNKMRIPRGLMSPGFKKGEETLSKKENLTNINTKTEESYYNDTVITEHNRKEITQDSISKRKHNLLKSKVNGTNNRYNTNLFLDLGHEQTGYNKGREANSKLQGEDVFKISDDGNL